MGILTTVAVKINSKDVGVGKLEADQLLNGVLNTVYIVAGIVAVISIIVGGIMYSTSQGDPSRTKYAKDIILYATIGLVVVMAAFTITGFILGEF